MDRGILDLSDWQAVWTKLGKGDDIMSSHTELKNQLNKKGYRLTKQRQAVLNIIAERRCFEESERRRLND